jgi:cytidine deaminase
LSDSNRRAPKRGWPAVERRSQADRRRLGTSTHRTARTKGDGEGRTPPRRKNERRSGRDRRDDSAWQSVPLELTLATDAEAEQALVIAATDARTRAQAPYSGFLVGAALETSDGLVVTGCNIENATYGLTLCAERVALVKALSDGHLKFTRIAVVADTESPTPPCGPCRQLLWEYCGDIDVILANLERTTGKLRLSALLPMPFDGRLLRS